MNSSTTAAAPSLKLIMLPLSERHSYGMPGSAQEDLVHEVATRENPHLRRDQLRNMISQEERDGYKCADYMSYYSSTSSSSNIQSDLLGNGFSEVACRKTSGSSKKLNVSCRSSICEWMYRVIDHFGADREGMSDILCPHFQRIILRNKTHLMNCYQFFIHSCFHSIIIHRSCSIHKHVR